MFGTTLAAAAGAQSLPPIDTIEPARQTVEDVNTHLRTRPDMSALFDAAEVGPAIAPDAGELITALLDQPDSKLRDMAATTLGFIRYAPAEARLRQMLGDQADAHASASAAWALGRLGDRAALPALRMVAKTYWYPPVRDVATMAIRQITNPSPLRPFVRNEWVFRDPLPFLKTCGSVVSRPMVPSTLGVEGGRLIGVDKGEFGGGLFYDDDRGHRRKIGDMNVQAIATLGHHIIAVTGLAHMGMVTGDLYLVEHGEGGEWRAIQWRRLPYAPYGAVFDGDHLRIVLPAADIQVDASGTFSMPSCPNTRHGSWARDRVAVRN